MIRINKPLLAYMARPQLNGAGEAPVVVQVYRPRDVVIQQGSKVPSVYIIKSGIAKCFMQQNNGSVFIQEFFGEGSLFGEVEVFKHSPSVCSIEAITDLIVYKIGHAAFYRLLREDQNFNQLILEAMAAKIADKATRHAYNHSHAIADTYIRLKDQFPDLNEKISKSDIANYLGVTLRSLNRTLSSLNKSPETRSNTA